MTQFTKIFYLQNNGSGNYWWVVQKFKHRGIYDVPKKDADIHQDDYYSDTERAVHEGDEYVAADVDQEEDAEEPDIIEVNLAQLLRTKKGVTISADDDEADDEEDEDDTVFQYCSDNNDNGNGVHDYVAEDDDDDSDL